MIQELIDGANPGDTITIPPGEYEIDTIGAPIWVKKSQLIIKMDGVVIRAKPNGVSDRFYFPIGISGAADVTLIGAKIVGDRAGHSGTTTMGHGVVINESRNILLQSMGVTECMGDGILIVGASGIEIDRCGCYRNHRQGLTATDVNGLWIHGSGFYNSGDAPPSAGVDFEPDLPSQSIRNIRIEHSKFGGNLGAGILIACPPGQRENIHITSDNIFVGKPIDGTDGIVPWWSKIIGPYTNWLGYPRELHI